MKKLEETIGYSFKDPTLLEHALRHSSYINEHSLKKEDCNERLEFLGDSILEFVSSEYLFSTYPDRMEGYMSKLRAALVCENGLAQAARAIDLGSYMIMGKGMDAEGGREKESIISDAFEALIAALYLDGGLAPAKKLIYDYVLNDIEAKILFYDAKTTLQEMIQSDKKTASYELIGESGPEHMKTFEAAVVIDGKRFGTGKGRSKKQAEQAAAYETIMMIRNRPVCI